MSFQNPINSTPNNPSEKPNVGMGIIAYILFFVPLLAGDKTPFVKFHTNQGFALFLFTVLVNIVGTLIPLVGWFLILPFGNLFALILFILGIVNAMNEKMKPLPLIGKLDLIK